MNLSRNLWSTFSCATSIAIAALGYAVFSPRAFADGEPRPWQLGMQVAATPVRQHMDALYGPLLVITTVITLFVMGLLVYVCVRYNARRHPVPSIRTHHALLEVVWTVVPVLILVSIAIPSFKLIFYMGEAQAQGPTMSLKITGHQWYWTYDYPNQGNLSFDSNFVPDDRLKPGEPRLLSVDNRAVVPVNTTIRLFITSTDVIHSWYVPSLGVQEYAMPGRVNEAWIRIAKPGVYRGQCNQLCGVNHAFMPIVVQAVPKAEFAKWAEQAKKRFAAGDTSPRFAAAG